MMTRSGARANTLALRVAALCAAALPGCAHTEEEVRMQTALPEPMVFAVAPILNFSGEFSLDPVKAADLLASELTFVNGATVLPVSRVVAVLTAQGKTQIESPEHAVRVADAVGADGIIVAGVTEFEAYTPILGVAVQLYLTPGVDPRSVRQVSTSRMMAPIEFTSATAPVSQAQATYNGNHEYVADLIKQYAAARDEELLMGWRQYLKVQTLFIRFCWHDALNRLLAQYPGTESVAADVGQTENPS
ncbi:MAG: hypothetical protein DCC65_10475 [Planctomycetota bacterium]|nr:MAG: hypothetical protein DCC65_10475 [Planctomycetota bacterium]